MNLAGLGSVISGIGSLGGLFGRKKGPSPGQQSYESAYNTIKGQHAAAKEVGLHPLFAMGGAVAGGGAMSVTGSDVGDAIAGVGNAITSYQARTDKKKAESQALAESNARIAKLGADTQASLAEAHQRRVNSALAEKDFVIKSAEASRVKRAAVGFNARKDQVIAGSPNKEKPTPLKSPVLKDHNPNKKYTDQELIEQQYGGVVGEAYGLSRYLGEIGEELGQWLYKKTGKPAQRERFEKYRHIMP